MPFLPVWLAARGVDAGSIGIVLSIPLIVRVAAIPVATRIADQYDSARGVIMIASLASLLGYAGVALTQSSVAIMIAIAVASLFYTPLMPLADAYALRGLAAHGRSYGPVRSWGSAAFIVGSLGGGVLLDAIPERELIWVLVAGLAVNAAAAGGLAPLARRMPGESDKAKAARALLLDPRFLLVIFAAALIQASHALYYGFSVLQWQSAGLGGITIGSLWALGVIAEIVLFAFSARLSLDPTVLLYFGAAGAVIRWGVMAFDPPLLILPVLQCLHALTFGATHLGAVSFVARAAPTPLGASAQGYLAVALALAMAGAMAVSGELYTRFDSGAYAGMALLAVLGGIILSAGGAGVKMSFPGRQ